MLCVHRVTALSPVCQDARPGPLPVPFSPFPCLGHHGASWAFDHKAQMGPSQASSPLLEEPDHQLRERKHRAGAPCHAPATWASQAASSPSTAGFWKHIWLQLGCVGHVGSPASFS